MLVRLLYFVLLMLVARLVFRAVAEVFGAGSGSGSRRVGDRDRRGEKILVKGRMVRDPVCGLNLPEDRAIESVVKGESLYFCSERCRDDFVRRQDRKRESA